MCFPALSLVFLFRLSSTDFEFNLKILQFEFMESDNLVTYYCAYCGEENETFVDPSAGSKQAYVEDCTVCCRPNLLHIEITEDGNITISAEFEG